ncbi:oligosaccharide flippase family protein [Rossellomorea marisflavi]|uniref:oligosaccharide flippase family protein n=1 Tax=Rossellomorea marisflavi TaxID=189381 RepID=UPI003F9F939F
MNNKIKSVFKNISYSISSNLVSMIVSFVVILIVPKLLGVEEYGYWQLYLFYLSYVGFLHFGWNDGIYLKYGGEKYDDLNKNLFFSQFWMLVIFQVLVGIIILGASKVFITDSSKQYIVEMISISTILVNVRYMLIYILQGTNRIKEFAQITILDRVFYCLLILLFLFLGIRDFKLLIIADIIGKLISLCYAIYCCRNLIFNKISKFYLSLKETIENINIGIKLMFANIASILIIGIMRFGIERTWDVATFGKVSLILSISNLMMIFINAIGIIMFPILRRVNVNTLPIIFKAIRTFLLLILLGLLLLYYPLKFGFSIWLPQYRDSLIYLALVFPMCIYEGKMAMLINTYLKTMRKEKLMLAINLVSVLLSIILSIISTIIFKNISLAMGSIVVLLAFRCILAEVILSKELKVSVLKDNIYEVTMTIVFIITSWLIASWIGVLIYFITYLLYMWIKRKDIKLALEDLIEIMKN